MNKKIYYAMAQSDELEPEDAANFIIKKCLQQLNGRKPAAGIIYMAITVDHQRILDIIYSTFNDIKLIGCTTDGEFSSETGYIQDSVLLMLFSSDEIEFATGEIDLKKFDTELIKKEIKTSLDNLNKKPRVGILFTDGIAINSEDSLKIMNTVFNGSVPFFGGAAADQWRFTGSKQFHNNTVLDGKAVYLLICGDLNYSFALGTGWTPVGSYGIVNKSERNIIKEINHMRAIDFYRELLGQNANPSIEMPMAIYDENNTFMYLRTTFGNIIEDDGSIVFLGDIKENYKVRLTLVDRPSIIESVSAAMDNAVKKFPGRRKPSIAICFSCTARRALLGLKTGEECRIVKSKLGKDAIVFGFYSYGEFSPLDTSTGSIFHNESFVCLLLE